jgi:DNA-binding NtrC family response regulator
MHCTEATDEGCAWFLTDPNDLEMQKELQERANEYRAKQQESRAAGRTVQAHKYGVMAERTERLRDKALKIASEEVRLALLGELNTYEEQS